MAAVTGFVEKIKYRNEDNGYSVISVSSGGEDYVLVGIFHYISEGEMIEAVGVMTDHPVYGEQLQVESYEIKTPEDTQAMERYLGSGAVKGVKAALAARIVRRFKADTFRIIEEEPERLAEVKGVSEKLAMSISTQMEAKKDMRQAMMFLQEYGVSMNLAVKIFQEYGPGLYGIIRENPYRLADDIPGVGFKMADEIARKAGILADSDYRIRAGILYTLFQAAGQGHTYLPEEEAGGERVGNRTPYLYVGLLLYGTEHGQDAPRPGYQRRCAGGGDPEASRRDPEGRKDGAGSPPDPGGGGSCQQRPSDYYRRARYRKDHDDQYHYPVFRGRRHGDSSGSAYREGSQADDRGNRL